MQKKIKDDSRQRTAEVEIMPRQEPQSTALQPVDAAPKRHPLDIRVLLSAPIFRGIESRVNYTSLGDPIKKSLESRLLNSKFAQLIKNIETSELLVISAVLGFSSKGMAAISMYLNAENSRIQIFALKQELQNRLSSTVLENKEDSS